MGLVFFLWTPHVAAMAEEKRGRGRPPADDPKDSIIQVKLTASERDDLNTLVAAWREDAASLGVGQVTASSVLRALVRKDLAERGLDKPKRGAKK